MDSRTLVLVPMLVGALALGGCGGEEGAEVGERAEEGVGVVGEGVGEVREGVGEVGEGVGAVGEGAVGTREILGNRIDDDGDGVIDEES